jgi:hypothetical protein
MPASRQIAPARITAIIAAFLLSQCLLLVHAHGADADLAADPTLHGCLLCASAAACDPGDAAPASATWNPTVFGGACRGSARSASVPSMFIRGPQCPRGPPLPLG